MSTYPGSLEDLAFPHDNSSEKSNRKDMAKNLTTPHRRSSGPVTPSESLSLTADLDEQSQEIEDGLLTMPNDMAREAVRLWSLRLRAYPEDVRLAKLAHSLGQLSNALAAPKLDGKAIGLMLHRMGMETRAVAITRTSVLGMCLDRLADALVFAGMSLTRDVN